MNKAVPWSIKGVGFDAREAAQEAARRAGLSLGEWLNTVIAEQAAETGLAPEEVDADTRLEAIAAKLARLNERTDARTVQRRNDRELPTTPRPAPADASGRDSVEQVRGNGGQKKYIHEDADEMPRRPANPYRETEPAARPDPARLLRRSRRLDESGDLEAGELEDYRSRNLIDPETLLNDAIGEFERRTRESDKKTAHALANVAQWIETSESRRENERDMLGHVTRKLDELQHKVSSRDQEGTIFARDILGKVTRKLDEIQHQVTSREDDGDSLALDALQKVARRLDTIENRVTKQGQNDPFPVQKALERLESRMEEISSRPAVPGGVENTLIDLDRKIAALNVRLEKSVVDSQKPAAAPVEASVPVGVSVAVRPQAQHPRPGFSDAVADIVRRQRTLDQAGFAPVPAPLPIVAAPPVAAAPAAKNEFDRRLEAIAARLEQAAAKVDNARIQDAGSMAGLQGEVAGLAASLADMRAKKAIDSERLTKAALVPDPQLARLREEIAGMSNALAGLAPRGSVDALESAMRDLGRRIEASRNAGGHEALLAPIEQLAGDLRDAVRQLDPRPTIETLQREIQTVHRKIENFNGRSLDSESLASLHQQMQEIRDLVGQAAARPLPVEAIERQISALSERIEKISRQNGPMGIVRSQQPDLSGIADNIRDVIDRALPRPALQQLENRLESLDAKINQAMARDGQDAQMAEISKRMGDVHRALSAPANPAQVDIGPLEHMMREISAKLETQRGPEATPPSMKAVETQLSGIIARLDAPQHGLSGDAMAHFDVLARSIDALQRRVAEQSAQPGANTSNMEATLRELVRTLESVGRPEGSLQLMQSVEGQLASMAEKLESSTQGMRALTSNTDIHFNNLTRRIDAVQAEVAEQLAKVQPSLQPAAHPDISTLEDMVRSLAQKMEAARGQNPSAQALASLEAQIGQVADRLEKSSSGFASLGSLERTMSELFTHIDESRHATLDAAENAARLAARDALREAMQAGGAMASPDVAREIAGIKSQQDTTDRRTHSTLSMVHDTLEKVVDRLATLEADAATGRRDPAGTNAAPEGASSGFPGAAEARPLAFEMRVGKPANARSDKADAALAPKTAAPDPRVTSLPGLERDDFLIEPGQARKAGSVPGIGLVAETQPAGEGKGDLQNIIAAARRVHQAQAEQAGSDLSAPRARISSLQPGRTARVSVLSQARSYLERRKGPALLAVAALFLIFGTVEIVRVFGIGGGAAVKTSEAQPASVSAPLAADLAQPAATPKPADTAGDARPGSAPDADAARPPMPEKPAKAIDPTPVGSIVSALTGNLVPPAKSDASGQLADVALVRLAAGGNPGAQYEMALRLGEGRGMAKDMAAAAAWLEKAAAQNLGPAQYRLGSLYEKGVGVTKDLTMAKTWYTKAANSGNIRAMHNLAVLTADGGDGKPDYAGASVWFTKAAEYGVRDSQYNLAVLYARGMGLQQNFAKSWFWFTIAANQGDTDAAAKRKDVAARLDNKQLEAAQAEVSAFKAKVPDAAANEVPAPAEGWDGLAQKLNPKPDNAKPAGNRA